MIERHHLSAIGMGGSYDPMIHDEENRIDLCQSCHAKAQQYFPDYRIDDLIKKRAADHERQRLYQDILQDFT